MGIVTTAPDESRRVVEARDEQDSPVGGEVLWMLPVSIFARILVVRTNRLHPSNWDSPCSRYCIKTHIGSTGQAAPPRR